MKKEYFINLTDEETQKKFLGVVSIGPKENKYPRVYFLASKPANEMNEKEIQELLKSCSKKNCHIKRFIKHGLTIGEYTLGIFGITGKD